MISLAKKITLEKVAIGFLIAVFLFWIYALLEPFIHYYTGWGFLYDHMK